jgi:hypothetical protein
MLFKSVKKKRVGISKLERLPIWKLECPPRFTFHFFEMDIVGFFLQWVSRNLLFEKIIEQVFIPCKALNGGVYRIRAYAWLYLAGPLFYLMCRLMPKEWGGHSWNKP